MLVVYNHALYWVINRTIRDHQETHIEWKYKEKSMDYKLLLLLIMKYMVKYFMF